MPGSSWSEHPGWDLGTVLMEVHISANRRREHTFAETHVSADRLLKSRVPG